MEPYPIERRIIKYRTEHGIIFKKRGAGVVLKHVPGNLKNKHTVPFTNADVRLSKDRIVTHNHPFDKCFSVGDFRWACQFEPKELRVACAPNQKIFSLTPVDGWSHEYWLSECVHKLDDYVLDWMGMKFDIDKYSRCSGWPFNNCYECWMHKACYKVMMNKRAAGVEFYYKVADLCNLKMEECKINN